MFVLEVTEEADISLLVQWFCVGYSKDDPSQFSQQMLLGQGASQLRNARHKGVANAAKQISSRQKPININKYKRKAVAELNRC